MDRFLEFLGDGHMFLIANLLTLVFILLQLAEVIDWSLWWLASPLWIYILGVVILFLVMRYLDYI